MSDRRHPLIAIEGTDATGKATLTIKLAVRLIAAGYRATSFSFPDYSTRTGKLLHAHLRGRWETQWDHNGVPNDLLNSDMLLRQSLMTVNRYEAQPKIEEALRVGPVVLDRWWTSSLAYGQAEGLDPAWVTAASAALLRPDLSILLDADPAVTSARRPARDLNESDLGKLRRVRQHYLDHWYQQRLRDQADSWDERLYSHHVIDAAQTAQEVTERAWSHVAAALTRPR